MLVDHSAALDSCRVVMMLAHLVEARIGILLRVVVARRRRPVLLTVSHMAQVSLVATLALRGGRQAE